MGIVSKPNTFTAGTAARASQVNQNFDAIYNDYNGGINDANISSTAAIKASKVNMASPGPIGSTTPNTGTFTTLTATTSLKIPTSVPATTANGMIWLG
jgi:hypothetical protein